MPTLDGLDVPGHIKSIGRYGIMDGTVADFYKGDIMETILRWKLGWISPQHDIQLTTDGSEQVLALADVSTAGSGGVTPFAVVRTQDPKQFFLIENRDSTATVFTDGSTLGGACDGGVKGNSGLVIAHVSDHQSHKGSGNCCITPTNPSIAGWWLGELGGQSAPFCTPPPCADECPLDCCPDENFPPTVDIEVPQGMIDTLTWVPDPVSGFDEMSCMACEDELVLGDVEELWGNGASSVFAPWTNPSTDLYWFVPNDPNETAYRDPDMCSMRREQSMYSGLTFYDIHWETEPGGGNGVMQVTVRYDDPPAANQPFVLPPDMEWDGRIRLTQDVEVPPGGTLTVNAGATVIASTEDLLAAGVDQQRVEIVVPASAGLVVAGTVGNEVTFTSSRDDAANTHYLGGGEVATAAAGDWYGIRIGDLDAASLANVEFRYARGALALEDSGLTLAQLNTLLAGSSLVWLGNVTDVSLNRDFLVDTGQTLTIPAGRKLGFAAGVDQQSGQPYEIDPLSELIVRGRLLADGNTTTHIAIRSDDPAPANPADFFGVRFLDASDNSLSSLSYVDFNGAKYAIGVDSLSGNLIHCTFANSEKADIYVDRDTRIADGYEWNLDAPTVVKAAPIDAGPPTHGGKDPARVEIVVSGTLTTQGTGSQVQFRSGAASPAAGDWYGIRIGDLDDATLGNTLFGDARGALALEDQGLTLGQLNALLASSSLVWQGNVTDVSLDRDFLVDTGQTLTIPAGRKLGFAAGLDQQPGQPHEIDSLSELIIRGRLLADGNTTTHIAIRSDHPAPTNPADFYGVRFLDASDNSLSSLSYVDFNGAKYAIGVDSLSGNLIHCTFASTEKADIYVDRDTRIPYTYQWVLDAPTRVLAHDVDLGATWTVPTFEADQLRVEFTVDGWLETGGAGADSVWFTSDAPTQARDDWFGITCREAGLILSYASIGHATDPVFFDGATNARLWNSRVYDFRDEAVVDYGSKTWIKDSWIDGAPGGNLPATRTGIHVYYSAARIEGTTVTWQNALGLSAFGIKAEWSKSYCDQPVGQDTLRIVSNTIVGKGEGGQQAQTGLLVLWGCDHRHPRIENNEITLWPNRGLHLQQCAETRVSCNEIIDNRNGVYYTRTSAAAGDTVRFSQNVLKTSLEKNFHTDPGYRVLLRPDTQAATEGSNSIAEETAQGGKNVVSSDATVTIDALKNTWWKSGSITTDLTTIGTTITGNVSYDPPLGSEQLCGAPSVLAGPAQGVGPEREVARGAPELRGDPLPTAFALAASSPNPLRAATSIAYEVPAGYSGRVSLVVYDVAGRAVRTLVEGVVPPGRHRATWTGTDQGGSRVMSGVYFVQLRGDGYRATRTVTIVK
ncbi:MAG: FlgD immunoglobulin-like domain containing protein [Candidatus Eiseniibacteriota bacterium]